MPKKWKGLFAFVLFFGFFNAVTTAAAIPTKAVVVFDLLEIMENGISKIYFSQKSELIGEFNAQVSGSIDNVDWKVIEKCLKKFQEMEVAGRGRWLSRKNQKIAVYVIFNNDIKINKINLLEDSRESRIAGDLKSLIQSIPLIKKSRTLEEREITGQEYILKKARGKLKISVGISDAAAAKPAAPAASPSARAIPTKPSGPNKDDEGKAAEEGLFIELLTGSSEHFFLTADVPVFSYKDAKFVNAKDKNLGVEPKDTPKSFYLGVNFHFVDVWKEMFVKPPYLKLMMQFAKTPFDSVGLGLGWNFPKIVFLDKLGFKTDSICLFGGIFWAKESDSSTPEDRKRYQWRWGLSFDLSKVSDWLKSKG